MKKHLFSLICYLVFPFIIQAQVYPVGHAIDSTTFAFGTNDSLTHPSIGSGWYSDTSYFFIDTTGSQLWQIGNTLKPGFADSPIVSRGIMTDTLQPYPANANSSFTLKMFGPPPNPIIDIWHEYQTDSGHAGGVIEFSTDTGQTWLNIVDCYSVLTTNVYNANDTLSSGDAAFTGSSNGQQYSRFQFFDCEGYKTTSTSCNFLDQDVNIYIRFRFVSDFTIDSLSGWKIDSIKIENTSCTGAVPIVNRYKNLDVSPNPSYDGLFNFQDLSNADKYSITIFNNNGEKVLTTPYMHSIDLSRYSRGLYFYSVSDGTVYYSGKLMYE